MFKKFATLCLALASFTACGTNDKQVKDQSSTQPEAAKSEAGSIPNFLIVKVPVDANGQEMEGQAESKAFSGSDEISGAESAGMAFEKGSFVTVADELDQDSSTSSWRYGRGNNRGNNHSYGRGYSNRRPYYSRYGNSYNYGYRNYYNYNSCNYYVYARPYYY